MLLLVFALSVATTARAEGDDANKNAARELAEQAAKAMEAEDYAKAEDLYQRAYALVPAPTLSLRHARALAKGGRWVEALEAYVRTTRTHIDGSSSGAFREAVDQAHTELAELRPRVPRAIVVVKGVDPKSKNLTVTVDGKRLAAALLGVPAPVNPGKHELVAKTGDGRAAHATLEIEEKEEKSVELVLPAAPEDGAAPSEGVSPTPGAPGAHASTGPSSQRTFAFVALGVGVAGLGVGVVTGLMATSKHKSAEDACPKGACVAGSSGADDADSFRSLRTISTVGYVVAVVGVGAGVTLWLTSPKRTETARVGAWVGPTSVGVRGAF